MGAFRLNLESSCESSEGLEKPSVQHMDNRRDTLGKTLLEAPLGEISTPLKEEILKGSLLLGGLSTQADTTVV